MRKRRRAIILLLIAGIIYRRKYMPHSTLLYNNNTTKNNSTIDTLLQNTHTGSNETSGNTIDLSQAATQWGGNYEGGGEYADYAASAVKATLGANKRVIIVFERTGDPTADALHDDIISHHTRIPKNTVIFFTNIDTETNLVQAFQVTNANTIIYLGADWQEIRRSWNGVISLSQLVKWIDGLR